MTLRHRWLALLVVILAAPCPAFAWQARALCPFDSGNCFRAGLFAASPFSRGLQLAWWDEKAGHQEWRISEDVLKEHLTCSDGEACAFEHLRATCYLGCALDAPVPEAFDARRRRLYFSVPLYDRRAIMLAADLSTRLVSRVLEDRSNGDFVFRQTELSPSGQYLAYLVTSHGSACEDFAVLRVFDVDRRRYVPLPGPAERWKTIHETETVTHDEAFQWESDSVVAVEQREWTVESCVKESSDKVRHLVRRHIDPLAPDRPPTSPP